MQVRVQDEVKKRKKRRRRKIGECVLPTVSEQEQQTDGTGQDRTGQDRRRK
jgi:hypothetical protein